MQPVTPDPDGPDDPQNGAGPKGLVHFLVEDPASPEVSREALIGAVQSLLRERDYLRRARDLQLADYEQELGGLRRHIADLELLLETECTAQREQAAILQRELAAHREVIADLERERDEIRADREAWRERARRGLLYRVLLSVKDWLRERERRR